MTPAELLSHCLVKPGARQDEPWEGDVVAKVGPKVVDASYAAVVAALPKKDRP